MANTDVLPQLLTIEQLAERLGVSIRHIRRLIAERRVPYLKVGLVHQIRPGRNRRLARWCSAPGTLNRGRPDSSGGQFLAIDVPHQGDCVPRVGSSDRLRSVRRPSVGC